AVEVVADAIPEVISRQSRVHDVGKDHFHPSGLRYPLAEQVDAPALGRGHRGNEFAAAGGRIQNALRCTHPAVRITCDLPPDRLPASLVDVKESVGVQTLI